MDELSAAKQKFLLRVFEVAPKRGDTFNVRDVSHSLNWEEEDGVDAFAWLCERKFLQGYPGVMGLMTPSGRETARDLLEKRLRESSERPSNPVSILTAVSPAVLLPDILKFAASSTPVPDTDRVADAIPDDILSFLIHAVEVDKVTAATTDGFPGGKSIGQAMGMNDREIENALVTLRNMGLIRDVDAEFCFALTEKGRQVANDIVDESHEDEHVVPPKFLTADQRRVIRAAFKAGANRLQPFDDEKVKAKCRLSEEAYLAVLYQLVRRGYISLLKGTRPVFTDAAFSIVEGISSGHDGIDMRGTFANRSGRRSMNADGPPMPRDEQQLEIMSGSYGGYFRRGEVVSRGDLKKVAGSNDAKIDHWIQTGALRDVSKAITKIWQDKDIPDTSNPADVTDELPANVAIGSDVPKPLSMPNVIDSLIETAKPTQSVDHTGGRVTAYWSIIKEAIRGLPASDTVKLLVALALIPALATLAALTNWKIALFGTLIAVILLVVLFFVGWYISHHTKKQGKPPWQATLLVSAISILFVLFLIAAFAFGIIEGVKYVNAQH